MDSKLPHILKAKVYEAVLYEQISCKPANCKEKILSEDYWDFILLPNRSREVLGIDGGDVCMLDMDFDYHTAYVNRSDLEPLTIERYWYNSIPNCYGLLDMDALEEAGIASVQNYPTLKLLGKNVMIGFWIRELTIGILCFSEQMEVPVSFLSGIRRYRLVCRLKGWTMEVFIRRKKIDRALKSENPQDIVPK